MEEGRSKRIEESKEHILLGGWERIEESKGHIPLVGCEKGRSKRIEESKGYIPFSGKERSVLVILVYTDETIAPLSYIHSHSTTLTYPLPSFQQTINCRLDLYLLYMVVFSMTVGGGGMSSDIVGHYFFFLLVKYL